MNSIRNALIPLLGWFLYSRRRVWGLIGGAAATVLMLPMVFQGGYALWWNTQVLPDLQAEYEAEQAEEARIAALPERRLPLPPSMLAPDVPSIAMSPNAPRPAEATDDAPAPPAAITADPADPTGIPLMPSGSDTTGDSTTKDAVKDTAAAFATAYLEGDRDAAADLATPIAQNMLTAEGDAGQQLGGLGSSVTRVDLLEDEATANVDVGDGMGLLLLTLRQDDDQWLVHTYHLSVPQGR